VKLFFYYPTSINAPANIGRELFRNIYAMRNKLRFEIAIIANHTDIKKLNLFYPDIAIYSIKSIKHELNENSILHIPTSPFVAPNERFILHSLALLKKTPLIINYHGDIRLETKYHLKNKEYKSSLSYLPSYALIPQLLKKSNQVIVNSDLMKNFLQKKYRTNSNVIPNALNELWFRENVIKICHNSEPFIFYHGRLSYEKGVDILIQAYAQCVKKFNIKVNLYIAGQGPQKKDLITLCKCLGLENKVFFLGFLKLDELKGYIQAAKALFYPSRYESFSLAILEALLVAQGPVFFSNKAGINDFVNREEINLFHIHPDVESIYSAMKQTLTGINSGEDLIIKQQKFAQNFTWEKIAPKYLDIYKKFG